MTFKTKLYSDIIDPIATNQIILIAHSFAK